MIEVVKQKIFQTWEYYPQNWSNMQRGLYLFTVSQSPQFQYLMRLTETVESVENNIESDNAWRSATVQAIL